MRSKNSGYISAVIITLALAAPVTHAQMPPPTENDAHAFPAQDHYSPYAGRGFPTNVYWGDTHLHTGMSMDAGAFGARLMPEALAILPGTDVYRAAWEVSLDAAEKYNEPGRYTALHGYEWTSTENGINRHRVVIYRDDADKAIGHNGNLSNGAMFPVADTFTGKKYDRAWAEERIKWEPLYEITQIKGDGETHPVLSPNDEFADYETWDQGNLDLSEFKTDAMLPHEYGRSALGIGLELEKKLGVNPYKFGFIGSTDSHTGLATAQEDNFFGKHSGAEPNAKRVEHPMAKVGDAEYTGWSDPEFDATVNASYYARVMEIPTPRWTAHEAKRFGISMDEEILMVTTERAYTSPIWYSPDK